MLATRRHKPEVEGERFDAVWKAEALDAGWGPDAAEALITSLDPRTETPIEGRWRLPEWVPGLDGDPIMHDRLVDPDEWAEHLLETELTLPDATFTRPQLVQAVAARLGDGATVATVERVAARSSRPTTSCPSTTPTSNVGRLRPISAGSAASSTRPTTPATPEVRSAPGSSTR